MSAGAYERGEVPGVCGMTFLFGLRVTSSSTVIRASGVAACDPNGKSDPYCIVYVVSGDQSRKTEIKPATLNPVWNETFALRSKTLAPFVSPCGK